MNHADLTQILIAMGSWCAGTLIWLWRHSTRLTRAEERITNNAEMIRVWAARLDARIVEVSNRSDVHHTQLMTAISRIEDKLDRKVDR